MVNVVLRVLSDNLILATIGWEMTLEMKAWPVRTAAETHD